MENKKLIQNIIKLLRPHHYIKNLFVFLPLFFSGQFSDERLILKALVAFISFCLISSSVYIFNDIRDINEDRIHPKNKTRPIASGVIRISFAYLLDLIFSAAALIIAFIFNRDLFYVILGYKILNISYTLGLKRIPIFDVMILSVGFVLRLYAGSVSTDIELTEWIIIMTFLLSMLIGFGKRRNDVLYFEKEGTVLRSSIKTYNSLFLNYSMLIISSVIIVAYILYTLDTVTELRVGTDKLYITAFWVIAGIMRYLQLLFVLNRSENPVMLLIRDHPLKIILLAWMLNLVIFIYVGK